MRSFATARSSRRDDVYHLFVSAEYKNNCQKPKPRAESHQDLAILLLGMINVGLSAAIFVKECCLCFLECDSVLSMVGPALALIPTESQVAHSRTTL